MTKSNEDNFLWLYEPIHQNRLGKYKLDEHPEVKETLKLSFDGSIMAVLKDMVQPYIQKNEITLIHTGHKQAPKGGIKIENADNLYDALSYYVEL